MKLFQVKLNAKSMTYLAMFTALTVVLGYVGEIIPKMPQGGSISIDIIAIFICAYGMGAGYGVLCGLMVSVAQFALGIAEFWGPWSVVLDYALPLMVCGLCALLKNIKLGKFDLYTGVIFAMILKFGSHFASGAFLFAEYAPEGMNPITYSILYNLPYNLATLVVALIIMPMIYPRIERVFTALKK